MGYDDPPLFEFSGGLKQATHWTWILPAGQGLDWKTRLVQRFGVTSAKTAAQSSCGQMRMVGRSSDVRRKELVSAERKP
jgi:hypothetical protein